MMLTRFIMCLAAAFVVGQSGSVAAQDKPLRTEAVLFAPGSAYATLNGRITGRDFVSYTLRAQAGQRMGVTLTSANTAIYFNLYAPGREPGDEALVTGEPTARVNVFDGVLPTSGVYTVSVYLHRNAARAGTSASYALDVSITNDDADSQALPEFWRVRAPGGLNLRAGPSTNAIILTKLADRVDLKNHGCRMAKDRRWCKVAPVADPGLAGWVAADFLDEGDAETALSAPDPRVETNDDLVPGASFDATGKVICFPTATAAKQMCNFQVIRESNGKGTVFLMLPDGQARAILYSSGVPVSLIESAKDGDIKFEAMQQGDGYSVVVGSARFVIPNSVIFG